MRDSDSFHFRRLAALKTPWNRFRIFPGLWEPFRKVALLSEAWHRGFPRLLRCTRNLLCAKRMIKSCVPLGMVPLSKDFTLGYFASRPSGRGAFLSFASPGWKVFRRESGDEAKRCLPPPFRASQQCMSRGKVRVHFINAACPLNPCLMERADVDDAIHKKKTPQAVDLRGLLMEPLVRFELTTVRLQGGCSTTELKRRGE